MRVAFNDEGGRLGIFGTGVGFGLGLASVEGESLVVIVGLVLSLLFFLTQHHRPEGN